MRSFPAIHTGPLRRVPAVVIGAILVLVWILPYVAMMPDPVAAALELTFLALAAGACLVATRGRDAIVVLCVVIMAYWTVLSFHPNVPSMLVAGLGVRKTVFALTGLLLALALPLRSRKSLLKAIYGSLVVALIVSITLHLGFPALESGVQRSASADTGLFDNEARLQGVFAGPFHVALAAVAVVIIAVTFLRVSPVLMLGGLAVAGAALYLTSVRSAMVALALALLVMVLTHGDRRQRLQRALLLLGIGGATIIAAVIFGDARIRAALGSLLTPWDDSRLLNRLAFYEEGWDLVTRSPVIGWGPGSAGDTLAPYFGEGAHVNSHNLALKLLVEGGVIGLLLWICLLGLLVYRIGRAEDGPMRACSIGMLVALLAYGLTGSAIETLPVSMFVLAVAGLSAHGSRRETVDSSAPLEELQTDDSLAGE